MLQDCKKAFEIWLRLVHLRYWREFFFTNNKQWILNNLSKELGVMKGIKWSLVFGITTYTLWFERNLKVFNDGGYQRDIVMKILGVAGEVLKVEKDRC